MAFTWKSKRATARAVVLTKTLRRIKKMKRRRVFEQQDGNVLYRGFTCPFHTLIFSNALRCMYYSFHTTSLLWLWVMAYWSLTVEGYLNVWRSVGQKTCSRALSVARYWSPYRCTVGSGTVKAPGTGCLTSMGIQIHAVLEKIFCCVFQFLLLEKG